MTVASISGNGEVFLVFPQGYMCLVFILVHNCVAYHIFVLYLCVLDSFIQQIFTECSQARTLQEMGIKDQYPS